jgi:hypothetical protein
LALVIIEALFQQLCPVLISGGFPAASYGVVKQNDAKELPAKVVGEIWENGDESAKWVFQSIFDCCGFANVTDRPASNPDSPEEVCKAEWNEGCEPAVQEGGRVWESIRDAQKVALVVTVIILLVQLFSILFSCCLYQSFGGDDKKTPLVQRAYYAP